MSDDARLSNPEPGPYRHRGRHHGPRRIGLGALLVTFGLGLGCQPAPPHSQPIVIGSASADVARPQVVVNGIAALDVRPDVADVRITLSVERPRPNAALTELEAQREGLVASLSEVGVSGVDLRSSHTGVSPVYEPRSDRVIRGYEASQTFVASIADFDRLGDVLERAAAFELGSMHTSYRSTRVAEKKRELREMALRAAQLKAEQSVAVLGVTLGPVISIEETGRSGGGWGTGANVVLNEFRAEGPTGAPVEPGAIPMTLTVEVGYGLLGAAP